MPFETIVIMIPTAAKGTATGFAGMKPPLAAHIAAAVKTALNAKYGIAAKELGASAPAFTTKSWAMSDKLLPYLKASSAGKGSGMSLGTAASNPEAVAATASASKPTLVDTLTNANNLLEQTQAFFNSVSNNIVPLVTGLVGGAAGGGALHWQQSKRQKQEYNGRFEALLNETQLQKKAVETLQDVVTTTQDQINQLAKDMTPAPAEVNQPPETDKLEDIKGIGPVFARRLNEAGIYTFADLANLTPAQIRDIVAADERTFAIEPEDWIRQARELAGDEETPDSGEN